MITETPQVAAALDAAAIRWPDVESRSALLVRLALAGNDMLSEGVSETLAKRRALIAAHVGEFTELYDGARR